MKTAFLYAGQGSQAVGMGKGFYDACPSFKALWDSAPVDFNLTETCLSDPDNVLNQTAYTQPCMVAFAVGVTDLLKEAGIVPDYVAGLSLGEYSALYCAGVFDAETVISLAAFRGQAMTEAVDGMDSAMMAVLNLDRDALQGCCNQASSLGVVEIANYNCPGQLVIGGEKTAVAEAARLAKEAGARRCLPLKVSGPFHTSLLAPAGDALAAQFQSVHFGTMDIPVVFNSLGKEMAETDSMPALLERQVQSSVYLEDSIRRLAELGVERIVEIGPGKVLSGFVRKTCPEITSYVVETPEDITALVSAWKG